jgi:serine palmitoyltransferase
MRFSSVKKQVKKSVADEEKARKQERPDPAAEVPLEALFATYMLYFLGVLLAYLRELLSNWLAPRAVASGYAPLFSDFDSFWLRRLYVRISDCWNRPICSGPGASIDVVLRQQKNLYSLQHVATGEKVHCLNLASYNYLGFGNGHPVCDADVKEATRRYSVNLSTTRLDFGTTRLHRDVEALAARFVGKEDAIVFGMGYATNSTSLAGIVGRGGLIVSDQLNHASLVVGCRSTGAKVRVFRHNDAEHLEHVLRDAIVHGQPRTGRPWTKILVIVEGIYSMEGEILDLPEILRVAEKYKAYLYVDEAHSIGALGASGRGVCDYYNIDPARIDILMGTFTKSFGSAGGYIAGNRDLIEIIRASSFSSFYDHTFSPGTLQQVLSSLTIIMGEDGTDEGRKRIDALRNNTNRFRRGLAQRGFRIYGDDDSPVIPLMLYQPSRMATFSRLCLENKLAVTVVGYPATSLLLARARFCVSASHTSEEIDRALETIDGIGDLCLLHFDRPWSETLRNFWRTPKIAPSYHAVEETLMEE